MNTLTKKEQQALRRWVKKIDDNTWEVKEHPYQRTLVAFFLACYFIGALTIVPLLTTKNTTHYGEDPWYSGWQMVAENIERTFMPRKIMEEHFKGYEDKNNIGYSYAGETKEEYIQGMLEYHSSNIRNSRLIFAFFAFWILYLFWPTKKRLRIERKRRLAYTYIGRKFYLTELDKWTDSLANYFTVSDTAGINNYLTVGVHPTRYKKQGDTKSALVKVTPFYTFYVGISLRLLLVSKNTKEEYVLMQSAMPNSILPRALIDFVNPDTPAEKLAEYERVITSPRSWQERIYDWCFAWLSTGLYCRRFPSQKRLQRDMERYFSEVAPQITELKKSENFRDTSRSPGRIGYKRYQTVSRRTVYYDVLSVLMSFNRLRNR
ncbi:MAG: hypothetical protein KGV50_06335 [Gammaproteobacteria bacterium]|nr:hypothetical protein [Gammaproteobacteria bacterium]